MLDALDRVKDWPDWHRWPGAFEPMDDQERGPVWEPIEAWFYRREFEGHLPGRQGP